MEKSFAVSVTPRGVPVVAVLEPRRCSLQTTRRGPLAVSFAAPNSRRQLSPGQLAGRCRCRRPAARVETQRRLALPARRGAPARPGRRRRPVFSIAVANNAARLEEAGSESTFWLGLLLIYLPIAWRLFGRSAAAAERLALVGVLGMALYVVKVVHSPAGFTLHDELASWRGVWDLLESGHLFSDNPLVGGYSVFPGMTAVTGALTAPQRPLGLRLGAGPDRGGARGLDDRPLLDPAAGSALGPGRRNRDRGLRLQSEHPLLRLPVRL